MNRGWWKIGGYIPRTVRRSVDEEKDRKRSEPKLAGTGEGTRPRASHEHSEWAGHGRLPSNTAGASFQPANASAGPRLTKGQEASARMRAAVPHSKLAVV